MNDPSPNPVNDIPAPQRSRLVPMVIGSAMLLQTMNGMMLANALPTIGHALNADPLRLNLAITLYLLASATFLPVSGWAADKWGAKKIFLTAIVVFGSAAFACGLAQNITQLLTARFIQGIAAAMMMPTGRLVLLRTTPKSQVVDAMAMLMIPAVLGPMIGPLVGGAIVTYWDWHWIFFLNLPFATAGVFLVWRFVPNVKEYAVQPLDWVGLVLTTVGLTALIIGFELVGLGTISPAAGAGIIAGGFAAFGLYIAYARRTPHSILDLSLFSIQSFRAAIYGVSFLRMAIISSPFLMAMFLQVGWGLSALQAGTFAFLSAVGSLLMRTVASKILRRFGFRTVLLFSAVTGAALTASFGFYNPSVPYAVVVAVLMTTGIIRALELTAFTGLTYADIDDTQMSRASTVASLAMQFIQSLAVGLSAMLLSLLLRAYGQTTLTAETVAPAFWIMGAVSLLAVFNVLPLPKDVGAGLHAAPRKKAPRP